MSQFRIGPVTSLPTGSTSGTGNPVPCQSHVTDLVFCITATGTLSAGVLTLEEAYTDPTASFGGTWSNILGNQTTTTIDLTALSGVTGGIQQCVHLQGDFWDVRPRISTPITGGGSITVVVYGT